MIQLSIQEDYGGNYQSSVSGDLYDIFTTAGFQVVTQESVQADARLHVEIRGVPISASYTDHKGRYVYGYLGASLRGYLLLEFPDIEGIKINFSNKTNPPSQLTIFSKDPEIRSTPESAPFDQLYKAENGLYSKYIQIIAYLGGIEKLSRLLHSAWADQAVDLMMNLDRSGSIPILVEKVLLYPWVGPRFRVVQVLEQAGWQPKNDEEKCAYMVAKYYLYQSPTKPNPYEFIPPLGRCAIKSLIQWLFSSDNRAANLLYEIDNRWLDTPEAHEWFDYIMFQLDNIDSGYRKIAINLLGRMGDQRATKKLLAMYAKEEPFNKKELIYAFGALKDTSAVALLMNALDQEPENLHSLIVEQLGSIGDPRACAKLVNLLNDQNTYTRGEAVIALSRIHDISTLPILLSLLGKNVAPNCSYFTVNEAILRFGDGAVAPLISLLSNDSQSINENAALILGDLGNGKAAPALVKAMNIGNAQAPAALKKLGVKAISALVADLRIGYPSLNTIKVLGLIKDPTALRSLTPLTVYRDPSIRKESIEALGNIADPISTRQLINALKDPEPAVRQAAVKSLGQVGDPAAAAAISLLLKDPVEGVRRSVASALGSLKDPSSLNPLLSAVKSETTNPVRVALIEALGVYNNAEVIDVLLHSLNDPDPAISQKSAEILGNFTGPKVIAALLGALEKQGAESADFRKNAALSLSKMRDPDAVDALLYLLNYSQKEPGIEFDRAAATAASTLANLKKGNAIPAIIRYYQSILPAVHYQNSVWQQIDYEPLVKQTEEVLRSFQSMVPGDTMIIKYYIEGLREFDTAKLCSDILLKIGRPAVEPLKACLRDSNDVLRKHALDILGDMGDATAIDVALKHLIIGESCLVVEAAATALGKLGSDRTIAPIEIFLENYQKVVEQKVKNNLHTRCDYDALDACRYALDNLREKKSK